MSIRRARTKKKGKITSAGDCGEIGMLVRAGGDGKRGNKCGTRRRLLQELDAELSLEPAVRVARARPGELEEGT